VAQIVAGQSKELRLGNLDPQRDWGHAKDYVEAMWRMLQQDQPDDYVIATGQTRSVRDFVEMAFNYAGLDYREYVVTDELLYRPAEVNLLIGNPEKAREKLGWQHSIGLEGLVREMVEADCSALRPKLSTSVG
jgi:GDPmannose 4,6-dehydratase